MITVPRSLAAKLCMEQQDRDAVAAQLPSRLSLPTAVAVIATHRPPATMELAEDSRALERCREAEARSTFRPGFSPSGRSGRRAPATPAREQAGMPAHCCEHRRDGSEIAEICRICRRRWRQDDDRRRHVIPRLCYDPRPSRAFGGTPVSRPRRRFADAIPPGRAGARCARSKRPR